MATKEELLHPTEIESYEFDSFWTRIPQEILDELKPAIVPDVVQASQNAENKYRRKRLQHWSLVRSSLSDRHKKSIKSIKSMKSRAKTEGTKEHHQQRIDCEEFDWKKNDQTIDSYIQQHEKWLKEHPLFIDE